MAAKTLLVELGVKRVEGKCNTSNHAYPCNAITGRGTWLHQCRVWVSASSPVVVAHDDYVGCDSARGEVPCTPAIEGRINTAIAVNYRPDRGTILPKGSSLLNTDGGEGRGSNRGVE